MRRPYTDMPATRPARRAWAFYRRRFLLLRRHEDRPSSAQIWGLPSGRHSWSMMVPFGGLYTKGDACVAPTQIYRTSPRLGCPVGARFVPSARCHRHNLGKSALSAARSADREILARRVEKLSRWRPLRTGRRMRRPYTDMPASRPVRTCVGVLWAAFSSSPWPLRIGHHVRKSADSGFPSVRHAWSMMVPFGGLYTKGDACVAPTQICPLQGRHGVRGRSTGGVFFFSVAMRIGHHLRKSGDSGFPPGRHPWSMMVPFGGLYTKGDACVAPTQIYRTSPRLGCPVGARFVPSARCHRHNLGKSASSAARSADREILAPRVEELSRCKPL